MQQVFNPLTGKFDLVNDPAELQDKTTITSADGSISVTAAGDNYDLSVNTVPDPLNRVYVHNFLEFNKAVKDFKDVGCEICLCGEINLADSRRSLMNGQDKQYAVYDYHTPVKSDFAILRQITGLSDRALVYDETGIEKVLTDVLEYQDPENSKSPCHGKIIDFGNKLDKIKISKYTANARICCIEQSNSDPSTSYRHPFYTIKAEKLDFDKVFFGSISGGVGNSKYFVRTRQPYLICKLSAKLNDCEFAAQNGCEIHDSNVALMPYTGIERELLNIEDNFDVTGKGHIGEYKISHPVLTATFYYGENNSQYGMQHGIVMRFNHYSTAAAYVRTKISVLMPMDSTAEQLDVEDFKLKIIDDRHPPVTKCEANFLIFAPGMNIQVVDGENLIKNIQFTRTITANAPWTASSLMIQNLQNDNRDGDILCVDDTGVVRKTSIGALPIDTLDDILI